MTVGPTTNGLSIRLSQAYGAAPATRPPAKTGQTDRAADSLPFEAPGASDSVSVRSLAPSPAQASQAPGRATQTERLVDRPIDRLIGGVVAGKVDFSGPAPRPAAGEPFPLYRRPGDMNEAATAVRLGRSLDIEA